MNNLNQKAGRLSYASCFPFTSIRKTQQYILDKLEQSDNKKYIIIEAMPGTGKSAIAVAIAKAYNKAYILTATKQLQDQYINEFNDITLIKGKGNYLCNYKKGTKIYCNQAECLINPTIKSHCGNNCPYIIAKNKALAAPIVATSYAYFFTWLNNTQSFKKRNILILDECHLFINMLIEWAEIKLNIIELQKNYKIIYNINVYDTLNIFLILSTHEYKDGYKLNINFINTIFDVLHNQYSYITNIMNNNINKKDLLNNISNNLLWEFKAKSLDGKWNQFLILYDKLKILVSKLEYFIQAKDKYDWIISKSINVDKNIELVIKPFAINDLFNSYIDKFGIDHIVFMSATILDTKSYAKELGLDSNQISIIKADSPFDPAKSPIYYYPVADMTYKATKTEQQYNKLINKLAETITKILNKHKNEKGIIHTGTYQIANSLFNKIHNNRFVIRSIHNESNSILLDKHKKKNNSVLLSPSLGTGADLKDDLSRFQIIIKLPWLSLADKRISIKSKLDYNWYVIEMLKSLIQMSGRSTRSEEDYSTTYILDINFKHWILQYQDYLPPSFKKRIYWTCNLN